jgi:hypothetical protein
MPRQPAIRWSCADIRGWAMLQNPTVMISTRQPLRNNSDTARNSLVKASQLAAFAPYPVQTLLESVTCSVIPQRVLRFIQGRRRQVP